MTSTFKVFNSHSAPATDMPRCLAIAPTMATIVVDCEPIVDPEPASIVRNNAEPIMARSEESHMSRPSHSKMISTMKSWPIATSVPVIDAMTPSLHVWPPTV
jgi:hypothetical protein